MNKAILSGFIVVSFILYSLGQRQINTSIPVLAVADPTPTTALPTGVPTPLPTTLPTDKPKGKFKDGSYTGNAADAYYGNIQVKAVITGGKLADVQFLQYPNDRSRSIYINSIAMPILSQEAIAAQSSQVDLVSGATDTSQAFVESLGSALATASRNSL